MRSSERFGRVFELLRDWLGAVLRKGRQVGAIRTDLPHDLVLRLMVAVDEAIGSWLVEHWTEFENPKDETLDIHLRTLEMIRKIVGPSSRTSG